jgi:hypothetical protein
LVINLESGRLDLFRQRLSIEARVTAIRLEECSEAQVFGLQIPLLVRDQEPRDQPSHHGEPGSNQEHRLLALECVGERVLDRRKDLRSDRGAGFPNGSGEAEIMASKRSREGLRSTEKGRDAGAHLTEGVEDAVEDNEEGKDALDGSQSAPDDKSHNGPAEETESHSLLTPDAVHKEPANDAAGEVETVNHGLVRCQCLDMTQDRERAVITPYPMFCVVLLFGLNWAMMVDEKMPNG